MAALLAGLRGFVSDSWNGKSYPVRWPDYPWSDDALQHAALTTAVDINEVERPLTHVLTLLEGATGARFVVDESALRDDGITQDTPVTIRMKNVSLHSALSAVVEPLNLTAVVGVRARKAHQSMTGGRFAEFAQP